MYDDNVTLLGVKKEIDESKQGFIPQANLLAIALNARYLKLNRTDKCNNINFVT